MARQLREDQLRALAGAYTRYKDTLENLASIEPCHSAWPSDPPGPGYFGTQCQLLDGHTEQGQPLHRHRVVGTQVVLEW